MRASKKRLLKKIFANISIGLLILTYFGSSIAGQFSGQINSFLGVSTSKIVTTDGSSQDTGEYPRYYESAFQSVAELKAAGLATLCWFSRFRMASR